MSSWTYPGAGLAPGNGLAVGAGSQMVEHWYSGRDAE